ncbi:MAG: SDR family oxidoreductase [Candidatus Velthaea sp.]
MPAAHGRLAGRVAVVTGAASGIGLATARLFRAAGAVVVAIDLQPPPPDAADMTSAADVADPASVAAMVDAVRARFAKIDVLAHFAGITRDALADALSMDEWDAVIRVNLTGSFIATQLVARAMPDGGAIVLTSSRSAYGNIGQANYAASKAGVIGLTRTLALELGRRRIRVNALAPGFIETPMTRVVPEKIRERAIAATPLRRTGTPDEVARAALFLASDDAAYITGQVLHVDGGRTLT